MCIGLKRIKRLWPVYLLVAMYLGILMLGLVLSRYRLSLAALLIPFAAYAVVWLADALRHRRWLTAAGVAVAMVGISFSTMRPLEEGRPLIRSSYYSSVYQAYYSKRAVLAINENNWAGAAELMISSLAFQPAVVSDLGPERKARSRNEASLAKLYAQVHRRIAEALRNVGKEEEARGYERSAERLLSAL